MMTRRILVWLCLGLVCTAATRAQARLGETAAELRQRFGKPESQPQKNILVWLIEESAGALLYTVTLNEQDVSIAEGLKPFRQARMTDQTARNFISEQLSVLHDTSTARAIKAGEGYTFGGEKLTCGENEQVLVDEAHGLLVVWTQRPSPAVLAVTPEMMRRMRR